jgi:predicted ArsR family transcriptional regulator
VDGPSTRELITAAWERNGAWSTPRRLAARLGRPAAEVRQEMERMESEGLAERWRENPGGEWRFGPPRNI